MNLRCAICLCLLGTITGVSAPPAAAESLFPPGGFRLAASNGYSIHALSYDGDPRGDRDALILFVGRKDAGVTYGAFRHVEVTETTIAADLGRLGSIDLHFVPTGRPKKEHASCDRQQFAFDSGFYEGRIDFEGEEGFTEVHASRAPGELRVGLSFICSGGPAVEGAGGHSPGALLRTRRHWPKGNLSFEVKTNSHTRPAYFQASIEERSPAMAVFRSVGATGAPAAFSFDVPAQSARMAPPGPFAGAARFERGGKTPGHLQGSLTVDLPGRSDVSLIGTRGSLSRYVANPSHPFRSQRRPALSPWLSTNPSLTAFAPSSLLAPN
ncbi:MAG: hypothetical protein ACTHNY_00490 [Solirubrobacterales bacterium]